MAFSWICLSPKGLDHWNFLFHFSLDLFKIFNYEFMPLLYRFDAIVSADAFENLKPAPDIFIAASKLLNVPSDEVQRSATSFFFFHSPSLSSSRAANV